jgi:hypothetical protein
VPLADALALLLLALDEQRWRFDTAAPRWHARLCAQARLTLTEAQLAVAALDALAGPSPVAGGQALVALCEAHGLEDAVAGPRHLAGRPRLKQGGPHITRCPLYGKQQCHDCCAREPLRQATSRRAAGCPPRTPVARLQSGQAAVTAPTAA